MPDSPLVIYFRQYYAMLEAAQRALTDAEIQAKDVGLSTAEQLQGQVAMIDIARAMGRLRSSHEVFMAQFDSLNPPSAEVVNRTIDLATKLAADIAANKKASAMLKSVTAAIDAWVALAAKPAVAPAATPASPSPTSGKPRPSTTWEWLGLDRDS